MFGKIVIQVLMIVEIMIFQPTCPLHNRDKLSSQNKPSITKVPNYLH